MEAHELVCDFVKECCSKCEELVVKKDRKLHDCIAFMLKKYKEKSDYLNKLSSEVDEKTLDINK
jgi:hypothetical protein